MGSNERIPRRGEIWWTDFTPGRGREIIKERPAIVLSANELQDSGRELVIVVPCSTKYREFPTHVEISPEYSGMKLTTYAMCEQIRAVSFDRLIRCAGLLRSSDDMRAIEERISALLGLPTA